jgi:hypothetical protein
MFQRKGKWNSFSPKSEIISSKNEKAFLRPERHEDAQKSFSPVEQVVFSSFLRLQERAK